LRCVIAAERNSIHDASVSEWKQSRGLLPVARRAGQHDLAASRSLVPVGAPWRSNSSCGRRLVDLNEDTARIGEHSKLDRALLFWFGGERHTAPRQPTILGVHVIDLKGGGRYTLPEQPLLVGFRHRVFVWLEHELEVIAPVRRHEGEPSKSTAYVDVVL